MKKHILFVDDELNILRGLKRSLRSHRKTWEMDFVDSAEAAMGLLSEKHYDAIVTDMRMPGMDGAELLETVSREYSQLIRIVLSGHSDEDLIIKSTGSAHQYLAKPCNIEYLEETLCRAFDLKSFLSDESLQSVVTGLSSLPSLPATYQAVMDKLRSPNATLREIGGVIKTDPAMTAKILQLVNSAFFGLGRHVSDSGEAAALIGLESLQALVLTFGIFSQFDNALVADRTFSIESLWQHSLQVGRLAKQISRVENAEKATVDDCFLAGLLHDIGILILLQNFPEEHASARRLALTQQIDLTQAEQEIFDTNHAAVGAYLLGIWALADPVVEAVAFHHQPSNCESHRFQPLAAVHAADVLLNLKKRPMGPRLPDSLIVDHDFLLRAGLLERYDVWAQLEEPDDDLV